MRLVHDDAAVVALDLKVQARTSLEKRLDTAGVRRSLVPSDHRFRISSARN